MNVKKYTAPTMEAALARVKSDLGRDAVILHTRCFKRGAILGLGGSQVVEVTASDEVRVSPRTSAPRAAVAVEKAYRGAAPSNSSADFLALKGDITALRTMVQDVLRNTRGSRTSLWPQSLQVWHKHLTSRGAGESCAADVLEPLVANLAGTRRDDPRLVAKDVLLRVAECIRTAAPIAPGVPGSPSIVALVGPTGVGKTTTIAKLAAHFSLREHKPVGLVTLDTYRIAAVEQLRTYARIIDVPLQVALTPGELCEALERLSECSLILIDTAGRSQRDSMKINDLKAFLDIRRPHQTHLVLAANAEKEALEDVVERFSVYRPDRILVTKIDELPACGKLLDIAALAPHPVSYITTGQDVPDDIETAQPDLIAALIAGEETLER